MAESIPPTPEEIRQLHADLTERMLDKAASDPDWKQRLLEDPQAALRAADFPELRRFEEMRRSAQSSQRGAEVRGQQRWLDIASDMSSYSLDPAEPPGPDPCYYGTGYCYSPYYTCWYNTF